MLNRPDNETPGTQRTDKVLHDPGLTGVFPANYTDDPAFV
jgi:hypothetical protein